jgi:hypothetical protein
MPCSYQLLWREEYRRRKRVVVFQPMMAAEPSPQPGIERRSWLLVPLLVFAWVSLVVGTVANLTDLTDHWPK